MKKLIKDFGMIKYYDEGKKDIWDNKILTRYVDVDGHKVQDGYMYKRTRTEINKLKKIHGKNVNIQEFAECPECYVL